MASLQQLINVYELFSGIKSEDDLKVCLQGYDIASEYPSNSGYSYTRYFFQEGFEEGLRFSNDSETIFEKFKQLRASANIHSPIEIPMQYITLSIDNCLKTYGRNGKEKHWPSISDWEEAIKSSGYVEAEIYNNMFK